MGRKLRPEDPTPSGTVTFWQFIGYVLMLPLLPILIFVAFAWDMHRDGNYSGLLLGVIVVVLFVYFMGMAAPRYY